MDIIEAFTHTIPFTMVAIASIALAVLAWRRRSAAGALPLVFLFAGHALWSFGSAGNLLMTALPGKIFFYNVTQTGILMIPMATLAFGLEHAFLKRKLPVWGGALLLIEPLVIAGLVVADHFSGFLGIQYFLAGDGSVAAVHTRFNVLAPIQLGVAYLALLVTTVLMLRGLVRSSRFFVGQSVVLLAGLLIPWLVNILEVYHLNPIAPLELTPLAFMAAQVAFLWGVLQYRLLDILPLARGSIIDRLTDGVIVLDAHNRITDLNPAAERITGCLSRRSVGMPVDQALPLECENLLELVDDSPDQNMEVALGEEGDQCQYRLRIISLYRGRNQVVGRLILLHDITDQKELRSSLVASEEKYRSVVERSNDGIAIIQDGVLCYSNLQLAAMLGYSADEMLSIPLMDMIAVGDHITLNDRYARRLAGEPAPSRYESFLLRKDGERLAAEVNVGTMEYEGRTAVLVFVRDVSAQKRASQELERSLALLQATIESTADGVLVIGQDDLVLSNRRFEEMWQLPSNWAVLPGHTDPFRLLSVHVSDAATFLQRVQELSASPEKEGYDLIVLKDDRIFERYATPYQIGGKIAGKVWNFRDVTQQKRAEDALQKANERLTKTVQELERHNREVSLLSEMGDMLHSCSSLDEAYAVVSDFAHRLFPGPSGALYIFGHSRNLAEAVAAWGDAPMQPDFPPSACWALRRGRLHVIYEANAGLRCPHTGNLLGPGLPSICAPLIAQSETIGVFHLSGLPEDCPAWEQLVTTVADTIAMSLANLRLRERLQIQSIRDPLTGLYNRRYMEQALELEIRRASRYQRSVGVIMMDIDNFKELNDRHGHKAGDALLQAFSQYLPENLREEDFACRYGGEEFLIILPEASLEDCRACAEHLRQGVSELEVRFDNRPIYFTISLGVASYPDNSRSAEGVVLAADAALYEAKRAGRNRVATGQSIPPAE